MNLALIICLVSLAIWFICFVSEKLPALMDLAKWAFLVSLAVFLLGYK